MREARSPWTFSLIAVLCSCLTDRCLVVQAQEQAQIAACFLTAWTDGYKPK